MCSSDLPGPGQGGAPSLASSFLEYGVDSLQRWILFLDVLRQRGNNYLERIAQTAPHVLSFKPELVLDGGR